MFKLPCGMATLLLTCLTWMAMSFINKWLGSLLLLFTTIAYGNQTILVVGDSLSAAYGIDPQQGWVALLQQRLTQDYPDYTIVNSSMDGNTTTEGLERLPELLKKHQPAIVLLEEGANDGLRGTPIKTIQANLAQMIELCQQQSSQVVLLGMRIPPNYGPQYTEQFAAIYPALSQEYKTALVDFLLASVGDNQTLKQNDMLHPTAAAQPQILANVWPTLQPLLKP
jgi:acyl-CoA thioesterase-1